MDAYSFLHKGATKSVIYEDSFPGKSHQLNEMAAR
ncbi:MAG: hypothetical protein ACI9R3_006152 [Verrucomicrobiales bacterium]|jgi:hypothetical protein